MRRILALDANRKPDVLRPDRRDHAAARRHDRQPVALSRPHERRAPCSRWPTATTSCAMSPTICGRWRWPSRTATCRRPRSGCARRRRRCKQALENGACDEEIEKLMAELREAMNEFLREFAERAQQESQHGRSRCRSNGQELRQSDLQKMLDQIENLAKSGNRDQAQELLSQLQDMMNNLQAGAPAAGPERPAELRDAPADGQARRDHAPPAGDDERDVPHGPDAARPAAAWPGPQRAARRRPAWASRASRARMASSGR